MLNRDEYLAHSRSQARICIQIACRVRATYHVAIADYSRLLHKELQADGQNLLAIMESQSAFFNVCAEELKKDEYYIENSERL